MEKYKCGSEIVKAIQYTEDNKDDIFEIISPYMTRVAIRDPNIPYNIIDYMAQTTRGLYEPKLGHYIVKDSSDRLTPYAEREFNEKFKKISGETIEFKSKIKLKAIEFDKENIEQLLDYLEENHQGRARVITTNIFDKNSMDISFLVEFEDFTDGNTKKIYINDGDYVFFNEYGDICSISAKRLKDSYELI